MLSNELIVRQPVAVRPTVELPLGLEYETRRGCCWRIDAPVSELWPEQERWRAALDRNCASLVASAEGPHPEIVALRGALPEGALLLDVGTTGSGSAPIVLAGALHAHKGLPIVSQWVARTVDEEAAVLTAIEEVAAGKGCLVTFNGKSCDAPSMAERRAALKLPRGTAIDSLTHCDLLYHARRRWKSRLPNCKLETLEQYVCGRQRGLPTSVDPAQAWQQFHEGRSSRALTAVLQDHAMDMITVWQLALWLARA
jgi:uncharacterized protein YprB with RNaseH-like and TPR domain